MDYIAEPLRLYAVPIGQLILDPQNARKHNARNLDSIADSLRRFGQRFPLVHDASNTVRIGNGRLQAARTLGWDYVASIPVTDLDAKQLRVLALTDNRTAELAEWDFDKLAAAVEKLGQFDLSAHWTGPELDAILNFDANPRGKPEAPAEDESPAAEGSGGTGGDDASPVEEHWYKCPRCGRKFLESDPGAKPAAKEPPPEDLIPELLSLTLHRPAQNALRTLQFVSARRWDKQLKRQAGTLYRELKTKAPAALGRLAADELLPVIREAGIRPRLVAGTGNPVAAAIAERLAEALDAEYAALLMLDAENKPVLTGEVPTGPFLLVEDSAGEGRVLEAAAKQLRERGMTFAAAWIYEDVTRT